MLEVKGTNTVIISDTILYSKNGRKFVTATDTKKVVTRYYAVYIVLYSFLSRTYCSSANLSSNEPQPSCFKFRYG